MSISIDISALYLNLSFIFYPFFVFFPCLSCLLFTFLHYVPFQSPGLLLLSPKCWEVCTAERVTALSVPLGLMCDAVLCSLHLQSVFLTKPCRWKHHRVTLHESAMLCVFVSGTQFWLGAVCCCGRPYRTSSSSSVASGVSLFLVSVSRLLLLQESSVLRKMNADTFITRDKIFESSGTL